MQGKRLIKKLKLKNFLSYGSDGEEIELEPLNVLIGPNASGKSNIIEMFRLLQATPRDLADVVRKGGGVREWLWKKQKTDATAEIEAIVSYPEGVMPLRYRLYFTAVGQRLEVVDEVIETENPGEGPIDNHSSSFYSYKNALLMLNITETKARQGEPLGRVVRKLQTIELSTEQSIISQRKDKDVYPEITYLGDQFANIRLYTDWNLGRYAAPRTPQKTDDPDDFLLEDASNLGLVLNDLEHREDTRKFLTDEFRKFYDTANVISSKIQGGTIQVFVHEKGLSRPVPATRLSDGTLRYLCLLSILCHPDPPPLICLEEPELGLHPDILPTIAELLIDAAQRTQLVVTTHSDILVSALSENPETILVCERDESGSHLRRLEADSLKKWLEDYSLGDLWRMGEIGGTRW